MSSGPPAPAVPEHFFRHEFGRLVAALTRRFGAHRVEMCEDAVQTALMRAVAAWAQQGPPVDPSAWLYRVAQNEVLQSLRREKRAGEVLDVNTPDAVDDQFEETHFLPHEVADDMLRMLFVCCDPSLTRESQVLFALKVLCGFSVEEIALRLFQQPDAVYKRLQRARRTLQDHVTDLDTPAPHALAERVPEVHQLIYLLFTEGYSSAQPDRVLRRELCEEAVRLAWMLRAHPTGQVPATDALLALMYLNAARFDARVDGDGGLLLIEDQDRSLWDQSLIAQGMACLAHASHGAVISRYHLEAGIAAEHCLADSYAATNWQEIIRSYELLDRIAPSPLNTLNRAIAQSELTNAADGLALLQSLAPQPWLTDYYLWNATLGELYRRVGDLSRARAHLERALVKAPTLAEQSLLARRIAAC